MSRTRKLLLLLPALGFILACQTLLKPVSEVQNAAGTAAAIATQAIELATQAAPLGTAFANPGGESGDGATSVPMGNEAGNVFDPQGAPLASWREIPIMPQAIAGQETQGMYSFKIVATLEEIQAFYESQLPPLGWSSTYSGADMPFLVFNKDSQMLTITITPQDGETIVLLTTSP